MSSRLPRGCGINLGQPVRGGQPDEFSLGSPWCGAVYRHHLTGEINVTLCPDCLEGERFRRPDTISLDNYTPPKKENA